MIKNLRVKTSKFIDETYKISFKFNGKTFYGYKGDTLASALLANDITAKAISTLTNSGYTAFQISAWRPESHILVFTSNKKILNQLSLLWGVKTFYYNNLNSTDKTVEEINNIALEKGYVEKDDFVINLTAMPIKSKGMVNTLRVSTI